MYFQVSFQPIESSVKYDMALKDIVDPHSEYRIKLLYSITNMDVIRSREKNLNGVIRNALFVDLRLNSIRVRDRLTIIEAIERSLLNPKANIDFTFSICSKYRNTKISLKTKNVLIHRNSNAKHPFMRLSFFIVNSCLL